MFRIALLCFLLVSASAGAQDLTSDPFWRINFLWPGAGFEYNLGNNQTLVAEAALQPYLEFESVNNQNFSFISINPMMSGQYRYYYNLAKRKSNGLRSHYNSGNFVGGMVNLFLPAFITAGDTDEFGDPSGSGYSLGPVWGIQRTYDNGFNLNLALGLGLQDRVGDAELALIGGISLGYILGF
ncbi:MAG: hypothetical protein AAGB22_14575 [Bacteroidota bacterium]